ncbi:uncharacterized [Tachysurus ichikawai]
MEESVTHHMMEIPKHRPPSQTYPKCPRLSDTPFTSCPERDEPALRQKNEHHHVKNAAHPRISLGGKKWLQTQTFFLLRAIYFSPAVLKAEKGSAYLKRQEMNNSFYPLLPWLTTRVRMRYDDERKRVLLFTRIKTLAAVSHREMIWLFCRRPGISSSHACALLVFAVVGCGTIRRCQTRICHPTKHLEGSLPNAVGILKN